MKTKLRYIIIICFSFFINADILHAQQTKFSEVINDNVYSFEAFKAVNTFDGHYIIIGGKDDGALVFEMDNAGNIVWGRKTGSNFNTVFYDLIATDDSCFAIAGNYNGQMFCMKISANGDTLWSKTISYNTASSAISLKQTFGGGYVLAGNILQTSPPYSKLAIARLSPSGNLEWSKFMNNGNSYNNYPYSITQTTDSGFILTGYNTDDPPLHEGVFLMKITSGGDYSWCKKFKDTTGYEIIGMDVLADSNGFVSLIVSQAYSSLIRTDLAGNIIWSNSYPLSVWSMNDDHPLRLQPTADSGYVFVNGVPYGPGSLLFKINASGGLVWIQDLFLNASDVIETSDKGLLITGNGPLEFVKNGIKMNPHIGIIKTDSSGSGLLCTSSTGVNTDTIVYDTSSVIMTTLTSGNISAVHPALSSETLLTHNGCVAGEGGIDENKEDENSMIVFPNPTTGKFQIMINSTKKQKISSLSIYNTFGEMIYQSSDPLVLHSQIDIGFTPVGIYFLQAVTDKMIYSNKIIICH